MIAVHCSPLAFCFGTISYSCKKHPVGGHCVTAVAPPSSVKIGELISARANHADFPRQFPLCLQVKSTQTKQIPSSSILQNPRLERQQTTFHFAPTLSDAKDDLFLFTTTLCVCEIFFSYFDQFIFSRLFSRVFYLFSILTLVLNSRHHHHLHDDDNIPKL